MKRLRILAGMAACAALASPQLPALAQSSDPTGESAQGDVAVTIYNNGIALVQDIRRLDISRGRSRIEFPDVSAQIRPETLSFAANGTAIVEQNFDFDLLTPAKLMEKAIGETVTLVRTNPATGAETRERAEVLSTAGGVVVRIGNRIEVLRDDGLPVRVIFDEVPPNLRARPTLSVTLDSDRGGSRDASIRYLTGGLGWSSDYVALYDERGGTIDVQGWVTLTNSTGTTFNQADTLLVAGRPGMAGEFGRPASARNFTPGTETANREQLGDFYLYPIEHRTTIANAQTKQVSFLDVQKVPARKVYVSQLRWMQNDSDAIAVSSEIAFSSSGDGGLGDALPAGTVRFYQRDSQGTPQFIGENRIGHTPMGSQLSLRTGDAFDIFTKSEVESRQRIDAAEWRAGVRYRIYRSDGTTSTVESQWPVTFYRTTMRYTLTNAKSEPVTVDLYQNGLMRWWGNDVRVTSEEVAGEQINADQRKYAITVPANGERVVRVTYESRF